MVSCLNLMFIVLIFVQGLNVRKGPYFHFGALATETRYYLLIITRDPVDVKLYMPSQCVYESNIVMLAMGTGAYCSEIRGICLGECSTVQ